MGFVNQVTVEFFEVEAEPGEGPPSEPFRIVAGAGEAEFGGDNLSNIELASARAATSIFF